MLGSIGQRYSTIAFGTLVVSVYASLTYMPETTWYTNTLLILAGALLYGLVAMLVYIVFPNRTVQENLAKSYEALGRYLQAKAAYFDPDDDDVDAKQRALARANSEVVQAFEQTRVSLFYRLRRHNRQTRTQKNVALLLHRPRYSGTSKFKPLSISRISSNSLKIAI